MGCNMGKEETVDTRQLNSRNRSVHENLLRQRAGVDIEKVYAISGTVGIGSIGTVTINVSRMTKELVDELLNEVTVLMGMDHPNIVRPLELFKKKRELYLVLPLCDGGDLYTRSPYAEDDAARYMGQLVDAVAYMHSLNVIHRDLKFENVLFASKAPESEVMVIDFGLAKANHAAKAKLDEFCGTLYSMAPEVLRGSYGSKCDVWSLGVLSYMLLTGAMPFTRFNDEDAFMRDLERERYDMKRLKARSTKAKQFVKSLLVANEEKRPTAAECKELPWIKGVDRSSMTDSRRAPMSPGSPRTSGEDDDDDDLLSSDHRFYEESTSDLSAVGKSLEEYSHSSMLRKLALMVVAHRSDSSAIKDLRMAFRAVDTANDGFVTPAELETMLQNCGYGADAIADIYNAVDINKQGRISYTEFCAACLESTSLVQEDDLAEAFDRLDSDDSGFITKENLREILGKQFTPELAQEMIDDGDYKGNGKVDYEEFMKLMREKRRERVKDIDKQTAPSTRRSPPCDKK